MEKQWKQWQTLFWGAPKSVQMVTAAMKLRHLLLERKVMTNLDSILKKQRHYFANKGLSSQSYGFSSSHVWMWELDYKESWALKNWCFCTVVLEKTLESPLDCRRSNKSILKEISPEYSLDGLMLKLKLQYFDHMMQKTDSLETPLMLGLFVSFYIFNNSLDVIIILECLQDPAQPSLPDLYNTRSMLSN